MCSRLPLLDPKNLPVPTLILRGEHDGIASIEDLIAFFSLLPNMNKQFGVTAGLSHASFQQKNYLMVDQVLHGFFAMPKLAYRG